MIAYHKLVLALLVGIVIGATGINGLHAQSTTPPAYRIALLDVTDPGTFQTFLAKLPSTLAPFNGRILVNGGNIRMYGGTRPKHVIVIAFDSMAAAENSVASAEYQAIQPLRATSAPFVSALAVEGVAP